MECESYCDSMTGESVELRVFYCHPPTKWIERPSKLFFESDTRESLNFADIGLAYSSGEFPEMMVSVSGMLLVGTRTIGECLRRATVLKENVDYAIHVWPEKLTPPSDMITLRIQLANHKKPKETVIIGRHDSVWDLATAIMQKVRIDLSWGIRYDGCSLASEVALSEYGIDQNALIIVKRAFPFCCC